MSDKTPTPHINAKKEDIARVVLMPGDPLRSKFVAENFLKIGRKNTQTFCDISVQIDIKRKGAAFQPLLLVFVLFFGFVVEGFLCPFGELAVCFFGGFCKVEG